MDYDDVLKHLSPCGLDCTRCVDYRIGRIRELSTMLRELLGNYDRVALLKSDNNPLFHGYPAFVGILEQFSEASCGGCRSDAVTCPVPCKVKSCHKGKGVDFCFQCEDYPCPEPMDSRLEGRWKERNDRMSALGVMEFYDEQIKAARY